MQKGPAGRSRIWPSSHLTALEPSRPSSALTPVCPSLLRLSHGARVRIPWTLSAPPLARPGPEGSMRPISSACSVVYIKCVLISMAGRPSILAFQVTSRVGSRKREFKSRLCPRNYPSLSLMQRVLLSFSRGCGGDFEEKTPDKCQANRADSENGNGALFAFQARFRSYTHMPILQITKQRFPEIRFSPSSQS